MTWSLVVDRIVDSIVDHVFDRIVHCFVRCMVDLGRVSNWGHGQTDQIVRIVRIGLCGPHCEDLKVG